MNRKTQIAISIAALSLSAACSMNPSTPASEAALTGGSCGRSTVQLKASAAEALANCGEPSYRDAWGGPGVPQGPNLAAVEDWYYNTGPQQPVQVLRFLRGRLIAVNQDGLGFDAAKGAGDCASPAVTQGLSKYRLIQACGEPITRQAYVVDDSFILPNSPAISGANGMFVGQAQNGRVAYREELAYKLGGSVQTVTLENGRVIAVGAPVSRS